MLTEANGTPLSAILTGANRHDVTQLLPLVEAVPPVRGQRGRLRRRPQRLYADRAYDSRRHRQELRRRHIAPSLARRGAEHGSGLGVYRWVVERTLGWLHQFRRLRVRYERRATSMKPSCPWAVQSSASDAWLLFVRVLIGETRSVICTQHTTTYAHTVGRSR